jgi:lipopolysaccharide export system permease protein
MKIPLLQRYLFGECLRVFSFVLGCITVLLVFVGVFQQAMSAGLDAIQALKIIPFVVPSMLPFTLPAALLLTVCVVYGRLTGDQEAIAAKAAGIHPLSLIWPALLLGTILSVSSLLLMDQIIPWSYRKIQETLISFVEDIFLERLRTEHHFSDPQHGLLVTVEGVSGKRLLHPTFRYTKGQKICTMQAKEAEIDLDIKRQQVSIHAVDAWVDIPGQVRGRYASVKEYLRWDSKPPSTRPQELSINDIGKAMEQLSAQREHQNGRLAMEAWFSLAAADFSGLVRRCGPEIRGIDAQVIQFYRLNTEVHSRYAMSCSCFFFVLLGTPFSMRYGKSQALTSFLLCFLPICGGYYPLLLSMTTQSKVGAVNPEYSMWVANVALGVAALFVMRRVIRY